MLSSYSRPYHAVIKNGHTVPHRDLVLIEERYLGSLERQFEGPENVKNEYLHIHTSNADADKSTWAKAEMTARLVALRALPSTLDLYFELLLED